MDKQEKKVHSDKMNIKKKKDPQEDIINIVKKFVDYFEKVDRRELNDYGRESS